MSEATLNLSEAILWRQPGITEGATLSWQGDQQLLIRLPERIDPVINDRVLMLYEALSAMHAFIELIPGYNTLALQLRLEALSEATQVVAEVIATLEGTMAAALNLAVTEQLEQSAADEGDLTHTEVSSHNGRIVRLPVCYGGDYGPDLQAVCDHTGLSAEAVIERHAAVAYRVYMLGFTPGFPYLGGMDEALKTPRLKVPRLKIPAGSVGIADAQTGVYPQETPGGWQIIGRTPLALFDASRAEPALLAAGDRVRFVPIDATTFEVLAENGGATWDL